MFGKFPGKQTCYLVSILIKLQTSEQVYLKKTPTQDLNFANLLNIYPLNFAKLLKISSYIAPPSNYFRGVVQT